MQRQPSAGPSKKKEGWLGEWTAKSIFKKHVWAVSGHKGRARHAPSSRSVGGGFLRFLPSVCVLFHRLPESFVCAALRSLLSNKPCPAAYYVWLFFSFMLSRRDLYQHRFPLFSPFVRSIHPHSLSFSFSASLSLSPWFPNHRRSLAATT